MKILVINAGSSSLKYQLIDMANEQVMAKGLAASPSSMRTSPCQPTLRLSQLSSRS